MPITYTVYACRYGVNGWEDIKYNTVFDDMPISWAFSHVKRQLEKTRRAMKGTTHLKGIKSEHGAFYPPNLKV